MSLSNGTSIFIDDAGQRYFYPYGLFGKGYLISPQREEEVLQVDRKAWRVLMLGLAAFTAYAASVALTQPLSSYFGPFIPVVTVGVVAYLMWTANMFAKVTRGLASSNLTVKHLIRLSAKNTPWALIILRATAFMLVLLFQFISVPPVSGSIDALNVVGAFALICYSGYQSWTKLFAPLSRRRT